MENTLKLVGKNSNEIFTLRYPSTLLDFCEFDFSFYVGEAIEVCNEALKTGNPDYDKITEIKKDIQSAHCFLQCSARTSYDKIVYDCWIDYVCRRDNIGYTALWNRFIRCKTPFEKIIFQRLCDFRYKRAVNEWVNIIRIQDYAKTKMAFVFSDGIKSSAEAEERRNYFDLMFSVTARELGCRLEELGVTKYYSICRTPGAPFLFPNISKEIIRHVLAGFDYSDDYSDIDNYTESADEIAMDAFSRMKAGLPADLSAYKIPAGKMENKSDRIYMPCGLKAAIDLEIDAIIESGMWLAKCKRCGRYFARVKGESDEYCSRRNMPSGKTCLEMYEEEHPRPRMTEALYELCRAVTDEMYSRVDKSMSANEYNSWHTYLEAMKQKVENGEIAPSELESFLEYSREVDISRSKPIVEVAKKEPEAPKERVVKPFVPQRISRSEIKQFDAPQKTEEETPEEKPSREGFFTSPSVQRQKNERPQISHIIRNGESLGGESAQNPTGFQPFESQFRTTPNPQQSDSLLVNKTAQRPAKKEERDPHEQLKLLEERLEEERRLRDRKNTFKPLVEAVKAEFVEEFPRVSADSQKNRNADKDEQTDSPTEISGYDEVKRAVEKRRRSSEFVEDTFSVPVSDEQKSERSVPPYEPMPESEDSRTELIARESEVQPPKREERPAKRVIKKNAAAITAYGKMSGQTVSTSAFEETAVSSPKSPYDNYEEPARSAESAESAPPQIGSEIFEPFKDIGSIFDVLEQSEDSVSSMRRRTDYNEDYTPESAQREESYPEEREERRSEPRTLKKSEVPSGIWTEDRHLFGDNQTEQTPTDYSDTERDSEPQESREKRHTKSRKTQRLYDVIMREPDDNPNFRKKK
ncbi:MAG: DUF6076 domain-containing protein [Oscillospiraceae bacterium]